jgi:hypothetical protein
MCLCPQKLGLSLPILLLVPLICYVKEFILILLISFGVVGVNPTERLWHVSQFYSLLHAACCFQLLTFPADMGNELNSKVQKVNGNKCL